MKKIAIIQSNYIPWKGYFDLIASVDEFIIYDEMQYTRRDWRNRNRIKTREGLQWLTIPVSVKGKYLQKISETMIQDDKWRCSHWKSIVQNYARAKYFEEIAEWLSPLYLNSSHSNLSTTNIQFIRSICNYLKIRTLITYSSDYPITEGKTERLVNLCESAGGAEYISGPSAKNYINEDLFKERNIELTWFSYSSYPEYSQLWGEYVHQVSILDLLFNCGKQSSHFMRFVNK